MTTWMTRSSRSTGWLILLVAAFWGAAALPAAAQTTTGEVSAPQALKLQECIDIALEGSVSLAISEAQREQAGQVVKAAWGSFLPSLNVGRNDQKNHRTDFDVAQYDIQTIRLLTDQPGVTIPFGLQIPNNEVKDEKTNTRYHSYSASASLNVFSGFGKLGQLGSAKNTLKAAETSQQYNRALVVQYVASAYYNLLRYERLLEVAKDSRDLAAKELDRSETYFRLGSVAKSDVLQARVRLEQTKLEVVQAQGNVEQSFADLAYAMNRPLASRFEIDRSALDSDFEVGDLQTLYEEALHNRADLESLEYTVRARHKDVTSASSGLWPSFDLFWSYSKYTNESPFRFGAAKSDNLSYGYQISWTLFDRLQTWTQRSQAKASARIAEYNLNQAQLDAQLEIRRLYNSLLEARERTGLSRETIVQAQEELRLAQERFRVGAGTSLDRITAEVNLASARAGEIQAICDFLIAKVQLDRAIGRLPAGSADGSGS
jgi:outer membrane protein